MIALGVDHQGAQHLLHLRFYFGAQLVDLAVFDEGRDVVIGMEAALGADQAVTNAFRGGQARQVFLSQRRAAAELTHPLGGRATRGVAFGAILNFENRGGGIASHRPLSRVISRRAYPKARGIEGRAARQTVDCAR